MGASKVRVTINSNSNLRFLRICTSEPITEGIHIGSHIMIPPNDTEGRLFIEDRRPTSNTSPLNIVNVLVNAYIAAKEKLPKSKK